MNYWHRVTRQMLFAIYFASMVMIVGGCNLLGIIVTDVACCAAVVLLAVVIVVVARWRHRRATKL